MKSFFLILSSFFLLTACAIPSVADFESSEKPLAEDELLVCWRFTSKAKSIEVLDKSPEHAAELEAAMEPLFQQLIPRIFSDLKEGKLKIRKSEDITDLEEPEIEGLLKRMNQLFGSNWQNLGPFMQTFHITQRRSAFAEGFKAQELELEITAHDPEGKYPEHRLGAVLVSDLIALDYRTKVGQENYDLISYLDKTIKYAYPISYYYQGVDNGLRTLKEAFGTKDRVLAGKWTTIEWLGGEANFTGQKIAPMPIINMNLYEGEYSFPPLESQLTDTHAESATKATIKAYETSAIAASYHFYQKGTYMYLNWDRKKRVSLDHKRQSFAMYPNDNHEFFNTNGDRIFFQKMEDGRMQMTITDPEGVETIGYRK